MKKFKFKFDSILMLRKNKEELILRELVSAQAAYRKTIDEKIKLEKALSDSLLRRERLAQDPVKIDVFHIEQNFINGTKQRIIGAQKTVLRAAKKVEKIMQSYLSARKQTQQMETLKDRYFEKFKEDLRNYENKQQDDLSIMRSRFFQEEL